MGSIRIQQSVPTAKFAVMVGDRFDPQRDGEKLTTAVLSTPGARVGELWTEAHSELSSGNEYLLEITAANAAALWKTGFYWDLAASVYAFRTFRERIAHRAFELYQERGGAPGSDFQDWLHAEDEVMSTLGLTKVDIVRRRKVAIVEEHLKGQADVDRSIYIPFEGTIRGKIQTIPDGELWPERVLGETPLWHDMPCITKGKLHLLWVEERCEWIGIEYEETSHFEGESYGVEQNICIDGPMQLNDACSRLILKAYGEPKIPLDRVLHTSPIELKAHVAL